MRGKLINNLLKLALWLMSNRAEYRVAHRKVDEVLRLFLT